MDFVGNYSPVVDLAIVVLSFIMMISLRESVVHSSANFKIFYASIITILLGATSNASFYTLCEQGADMSILLLLRSMYRICMIITLELYIMYFCQLLLIEDRRIVVNTMCINAVLLVCDILEPMLGLVSYETPFSLGFFLAFVMSIGVCAVLIHRNSHAIIKQLRKSLLLTELICLFLIIEEYRHGHSSFMTFTFMLPVLVVMFMAHSSPYNLKTGALSMDAFDGFLEEKGNDKTYFMCVKFLVNEDFKIPDELGVALRGFWQEYFQKAVLFNPMPDFVVLAVRDYRQPEAVRAKLEQIMTNLYPEYQERFHINYKVVAFTGIGFCSSFSEFYKIFNFFADDIEQNTYKICEDEDMKSLLRTHTIIEELQDIYDKYDLNDERVLVYCQPIKNASQQVYDTAEALMRLKLSKEGVVFPNEFIPLIESHNFTHRFSMIILNKVCKKMVELQDYNIHRISVNFSVYELMNDSFVDDFKSIVSANGVGYDKIGVEFTESTDINDFRKIKDVITELHDLGTTIYLDDFGTGYSNFERLLGLSMDVVKFDRSLLLLAEDDVKAQYVLKSFSDTFMKMKFKVLYEGVETNAQEALCVDSNADYLQGFKYSRPIPIDELKSFLTKKEEV